MNEDLEAKLKSEHPDKLNLYYNNAGVLIRIINIIAISIIVSTLIYTNIFTVVGTIVATWVLSNASVGLGDVRHAIEKLWADEINS